MDALSGFMSRQLRVRGLVQGVGFRPHVWRLANDASLVGTVRNDNEGVLIEVAGELAALERFQDDLRTEAPPLARIDSIEPSAWRPHAYPSDFSIVTSDHGTTATGIVPDAATCSDCLGDIRDPSNRRFGYAFTNCTHCGPRLSIVKEVPYDRSTTAMADFQMCPNCAAEYADPSDRRFHAQPNACPDCGPKVWLEVAGADGVTMVELSAVVADVADRLRHGQIVAVKGLGGFHLACDATHEAAVARLRERKRRYAKPFAVMVSDLDMAVQFADLCDDEACALESTAAPIVLMQTAGPPEKLAPSVSLEHDSVGLMLPYTPLHHLLLDAFGGPLVMTSGNDSDEPQVISNASAREKLVTIADAFLMHDRAIINRVDDSVGRVECGRFRLIRRARGYAPAPLSYPSGFDKKGRVLAMGSELKNTFALTTPDGVVLSQHCGDLDDHRAAHAYRETLALFQRLYDHQPSLICVDAHPDFLSTTTGEEIAQETGAQLLSVGHHHAHLASVLGENGYPLDGPPVVGLMLDGLGYSPDGALWGGEVLVGDYRTAERVAGLQATSMPGGERCAREPWRNLVAHLHEAGLDPLAAGFDRQRTMTLVQMMERGFNAPKASSAGRLFDAFAALLGLHADKAWFEGQAALALEMLAKQVDHDEGYAICLGEAKSLVSFWIQALEDRDRDVAPALMARRFHVGLASAFASCAAGQAREAGIGRVALSGGVFQNQLLSSLITARLADEGLQVMSHQHVPCNDGGLSLGQAMIGSAILQ